MTYFDLMFLYSEYASWKRLVILKTNQTSLQVLIFGFCTWLSQNLLRDSCQTGFFVRFMRVKSGSVEFGELGFYTGLRRLWIFFFFYNCVWVRKHRENSFLILKCFQVLKWAKKNRTGFSSLKLNDKTNQATRTDIFFIRTVFSIVPLEDG